MEGEGSREEFGRSVSRSMLICSYMEGGGSRDQAYHAPQVLCRHGDVVVDVTGDLLVVRCEWCCHVVTGEKTGKKT